MGNDPTIIENYIASHTHHTHHITSHHITSHHITPHHIVYTLRVTAATNCCLILVAVCEMSTSETTAT